jgi:hypothetical protein
LWRPSCKGSLKTLSWFLELSLFLSS